MAVLNGNHKGRLTQRILKLLDQVEYREVRDRKELAEVFRLRHDAYVREGAIDPNPLGKFTDPVDEDANTHILGVYIEGELAGSIRLSVSAPRSTLPTSHVFPEHLEPITQSGKVVVDPTRFVACSRQSRLFPELPYVTLRLPWMAMYYFEADIMLAAVRPEHQAFYQRMWGNRLICEARAYPSLRKPVSLSILSFHEVREEVESRFPFFQSSEAERQAIFGVSHLSENGMVAGDCLTQQHCIR